MGGYTGVALQLASTAQEMSSIRAEGKAQRTGLALEQAQKETAVNEELRRTLAAQQAFYAGVGAPTSGGAIVAAEKQATTKATGQLDALRQSFGLRAGIVRNRTRGAARGALFRGLASAYAMSQVGDTGKSKGMSRNKALSYDSGLNVGEIR